MISLKSAVASATLLLSTAPAIASPAAAKTTRTAWVAANTWCTRAGAAAAEVGAAVAGASTAAGAAVAHSSGPAIRTSVGVGGSGYVAGTLGGVAATTLALASAPAVIAVAAAVSVAGAGTYAFCRHRR